VRAHWLRAYARSADRDCAARDVVAAMAAITTAVNDGRLTAEEAGQLVHILNGYIKALETHDLATRIAALESQPKTRS
jgi:hypothetical protein